MHATPRRACAFALCAFPLTAAAQPCTPEWDPDQDEFTASGAVRALLSPSPFGEAVAGGAFTSIAEASTPFIAALDDDVWLPIGSGFDDSVFALANYQNALIAGGKFTASGAVVVHRIARWNFTEWEPLGAGVDGSVFAMRVFDDGVTDALVVAGEFQTAGGAPASGVAAWDGNTWSALDTGLQAGAKTGAALAIFNDGANDMVVVGGSFLGAGGQPSPNIASWDGADWNAMGAGLNGTVRALVVYQGTLIAGGDFTASGATPVSHLAQWDGAAWVPFTGGANGPVHTLEVVDGELIAGGEFLQIGSVSANRIAMFDGQSWSPLNEGSTSIVRAMAPHDDGLLVGANAVTPAGSDAIALRRWQLCDDAIPGDLNGDGAVDGADLAALLAQWGGAGAADMNDDSIVNGADLATLLSNWG